jgi:hypothetical protein
MTPMENLEQQISELEEEREYLIANDLIDELPEVDEALDALYRELDESERECGSWHDLAN